LHQVPDVQNPDVALWYNRRASRRSGQAYREAPISEDPASTRAELRWLTIMQIRRTWEQAAALARPSLHLVLGHSVLVLVLMLGLASHEPEGTWDGPWLLAELEQAHFNLRLPVLAGLLVASGKWTARRVPSDALGRKFLLSCCNRGAAALAGNPRPTAVRADPMKFFLSAA
jgi:hypothetical protein